MPAPLIVYTAGMTRSGSTLLERMLSAAPGTVACGEINLLWNKISQGDLCGCGLPFRECEFWSEVLTRTFGEEWPERVPEMRALNGAVGRLRNSPALMYPRLDRRFAEQADRCRNVLRRLYGAIADVSGCGIVLDSSKTPAYAFVLAAMAQGAQATAPRDDGVVANGDGVPSRPRLLLLHMVRDSRAVAHSWRRHKPLPEAGGRPLRKRSLRRSSFDWMVRNALVERLAARGIERVRVRYEDLVREPVHVLAEILAAIGLERSLATEILGGTAVERDASVLVKADHTVAGNPLRFERGPMRIVADDEWRQTMRRGDRLLVSLLTLPGLVRYGYVGGRRR